MIKKKIIALVGALATAFAVHGASLNWSLAAVQNSDGVSGAAQGYVAYMFVTAATGNTMSFVPDASITTVDAVKNSIKDGSFSAAEAYHSGLSNAGGAYAPQTGISANFNAGDSISAFVVIFDAADYASANNYIVTDVKSASWASSTGAQMLVYGSMKDVAWTLIPEPTSGLLALLGFAGLALRRRRA